jgi:hypothetical protein
MVNRAIILLQQSQETGNITLLQDSIELQREALKQSDNIARVQFAALLGLLAVSLCLHFEQTGDTNLLDESIELGRKAVQTGHPDPASSRGSLANSLRTRFEQTENVTLLDEAITLDREALQLRPVGHPDRAVFCETLAHSLIMRFELTGAEALSSEAISLQREALLLEPMGHPNYLKTCGNLARLLRISFEQTGEEDQLNEAIILERQVLHLVPLEHPDREKSCSNLAASLFTHFQHTGNEVLLNEAIALEREALHLPLRETLLRARSSGCLAALLMVLFDRTGDDTLLDEAISLQREALRLCPKEDHYRTMSYGNLAVTLQKRFYLAHDVELLKEAIGLYRESLLSLPTGHPDRAISCGNLSASLQVLFHQTRVESLINEAISLDKEALQMRPVGHPSRAVSCGNLATSLKAYLDHISDEAVLAEFIQLNEESIKLLPVGHPNRWRPLLLLAELHLDSRHGSKNIEIALNMILEAVSHNANELPGLLTQAALYLHRADIHATSLKKMLLQCYTAVIDLALLVAGFVLDQASQLRYLNTCRHLGPGACLAAINLNDVDGGLELLERTRGVVWSQSLHLRDPQLQEVENVDPTLALELTSLLRHLGSQYKANQHKTDDLGSIMPDNSHNRDMRHQNHGRAQRLIREIRGMPGLADFMRGPSREALKSTAATHPVVILVAKDEECHALIIRSPTATLASISLTRIKASEITSLMLTESASHMRSIGIRKPQMRPTFHRMLAKLWDTVVKPVFDHLELTVSPQMCPLMNAHLYGAEGCGSSTDPNSLVPYRRFHVCTAACSRNIRRAP